MWQADITHWQLDEDEHVEILNLIDDHSRLFLRSKAHLSTQSQGRRETPSTRQLSCTACQPRCSSDNGAVFTASPRGGKVLLQSELEELGVAFKNSRPYHPQTCGKIERLHQTLKRYLAEATPAKSICELQSQLDTFVHYYNDIRPHRALGGRTPLQAYSARIKAKAASEPLLGRTSGCARTGSTPTARSACAT